MGRGKAFQQPTPRYLFVGFLEAVDRRQLHRERWALTSERNRHTNRIKSLLATQGISLPINGVLPKELNHAREWDDSPIPLMLRFRLIHEYARLQLVEQQINAIEQEQRQAIRQLEHPSTVMVRDLMRLKSIHIHTAWPLTMEFFSWRQFRNPKEIGGLVDLELASCQSGEIDRELGMSKYGNAHLRSLAVGFAWQ